MLLEGALAVIVILACTAGLGMGVKVEGKTLTGRAAWEARYQSAITTVVDPTTGAEKSVGGWKGHSLGKKVGAFIEGGANFLSAIGIPIRYGIAIVAVLVASFAATTLDTATRLQRYVVQELANTLRIKPLTNRYVATSGALLLAFAVAMSGPNGYGKGAENRDALSSTDGEFVFRTPQGQPGTINDPAVELWLVDSASGEETHIRSQYGHSIFHSATSAANNHAPNPDSYSHVVGRANSVAGELLIGFEDLYGGGDNDYDDTVIVVELGQTNVVGLLPTPSGNGGKKAKFKANVAQLLASTNTFGDDVSDLVNKIANAKFD